MPIAHDPQTISQSLPARLYEATVLDPPLDAKGWLRVEVEAQKGSAVTCPWLPRLDVPVMPGDAAIVEESNEGNYWCIAWWPQKGLVPTAFAPLVGGLVPLANLPVLDVAHLPSLAGAPTTVGPTGIPLIGIGNTGSKRAGRVLTVADFTTLLGIAAPIALYNLGNAADSSGNGRNLTPTTAPVVTTRGITGAPNEAATPNGQNAAGLFTADGNGGPFNFRTGSFGCWFKTAKLNTSQRLMAKGTNVSGARSWFLSVDSSLVARIMVSVDGANPVNILGTVRVADDRWHFGVGTYDGTTARLYVDGDLDGAARVGSGGDLFQGAMPFNIGNGGITAAAGTGSENFPMFGPIDEAFVHAEVLDLEQVRLLMAASVAHGLTAEPSAVSVKVRRRRRGGPLATTDFPTAPRRLYNFTGGVLTDQGSDNVAVTALGTVTSVDGVDGQLQGAKSFPGSGANLLQAAAPSFIASSSLAKSFGCWFQTDGLGAQMTLYALANGSGGSGATDWRPLYIQANGVPATWDGTALGADGGTPGNVASVVDGVPHFWVATWDSAAADGLKRKIYLDGLCVGADTSFPAVALGTNGVIVLGADTILGGEPYKGLLDGVFGCDYALTAEQIAVLFAVGSRALPATLFDSGIVEAMDATNLYLLTHHLAPQQLLDLRVAA